MRREGTILGVRCGTKVTLPINAESQLLSIFERCKAVIPRKLQLK